jgi:UDP-glucuronate 4-epimerase
MKILVTGCAGFIGSHVTERLLKEGHEIIGIDNLNEYYDVKQKYHNLEILKKYENFYFKKEDIVTTNIINEVKPDKICHLASMAGVRYSIENPNIYVDVNIGGFINLLEQAIKNNVKNFVYASSSSVYGLNKSVPFSESDKIQSCNSPYAASKRSMEIFANTYNQLYKIPLIGLRFFTVYGPRGRPDMAPYKFLNAISCQKKFDKYGNGDSMRDYTYIDDIVDGVIASLNSENKDSEIINLGNSSPISLNKFIETCEKVTSKKANFKQLGDQLGDVPVTFADISKAEKLLNYKPKIGIEEGLTRTYSWLKEFNNSENNFIYE